MRHRFFASSRLTATVCGVAAVVFGQIALAADLPRKAPVYAPPPPPPFSWTGFYVGAAAGAAWTKADVTLNTVNDSLAELASFSLPDPPTAYPILPRTVASHDIDTFVLKVAKPINVGSEATHGLPVVCAVLLKWNEGGGIDYALTPNWIVSVKYLHVDLGSISASGLVTTGSTDNATMNFSTKLTSDLVRGGISYKFY